VINALLGERYLKEGVVPTTNEITFLRYNDLDIEQQRCERHPDGQYICYLPAPILKEVSQFVMVCSSSLYISRLRFSYTIPSNYYLLLVIRNLECSQLLFCSFDNR